jgi:hypothetical protein
MSIFKKTFSIFLSLTIMLSAFSFTSIFAEESNEGDFAYYEESNEGNFGYLEPAEATLRWIYFIKTTDGEEPANVDIVGTYGDYYYGKKSFTLYDYSGDIPDTSSELYIYDINDFARSLYYSVENVEEVRVWYGYWNVSSMTTAGVHYFDGTGINLIWTYGDEGEDPLTTVRNYPEGLPFEETVLIEDFPSIEEQNLYVIQDVLRANGIKSFKEYYNYCIRRYPEFSNTLINKRDITKKLYEICGETVLEKYRYHYSWGISDDGKGIDVGVDAIVMPLEEDELIDPVTLQELLGEEFPRYGYVCNSETIGISDVILLSKHVYGKLTLDPDSQEYKNANCDLRSNAVDASDLKALIDFLIGKVEALPVREKYFDNPLIL